MTRRRQFLSACLAAGGLVLVPKLSDRYRWKHNGLLLLCEYPDGGGGRIIRRLNKRDREIAAYAGGHFLCLEKHRQDIHEVIESNWNQRSMGWWETKGRTYRLNEATGVWEAKG